MRLPKNPDDLLTNLRERLRIPSDYQLAKHLEISRAALSTWRNEKDAPGDDVALRIADFLKLPRCYVVAVCHRARARSDEVRAFWDTVIKQERDKINGKN